MRGAEDTTPNSALHTAVTPEEQRTQLEKVFRSEVFRQAPGLQKFLEYITSKAIEGLSHEIKESTIGIEVFGRTPDYDPKTDTVVRVQAHRLREKLKEYYNSQGVEDDILLVIPKGHYVPCFSRRPTAATAGLEASQPLVSASGISASARQGSGTGWANGPSLSSSIASRAKWIPWLLAGLAVMGLLFSLGFLLPRLTGSHSREGAGATRSGAASLPNPVGPLRDLWADFLKDESSPIVAYSNTVFLVTETSDLLRLKSEEVDNLGAPASTDVASRLIANPRLLARAGPVFFEDVYTGTGEVMAVFYLTRLFAQFSRPMEVKRSRLVTTNDLTRHDLIFLGSTREDALLAGLPLTQDFAFAWPQDVGVWSGRIVNLHPKPGESLAYEVERDPKTHVVRADYALVSFLPGIVPNRKIAVLGGLTTFGTEAAAEFSTSPSQVADLTGRLEGGSKNLGATVPPFFQAVLRVEIIKGDILSLKCVAAHTIRTAQRSSPRS